MRSVIGVALIALTPLASALLVSPPAKVLVCGGGAIQALTARIAAIKGYDTTLCCTSNSLVESKKLCFDDKFHPEGSLPLKLLCVSGPDAAEESEIDECVSAAEGLIIAFDSDRQYIPDKALSVLASGDKLKHISVMSRYLNGAGMGFFATAAKAAANQEVWAADAASVAACKEQEALVQSTCKAKGATYSVIRAGTLKGGAMADAAIEPPGSGEASFLNEFFYTLGQQDVVNWRLLYDVEALGVELSKGDTLPGPGFTAALTATSAVGDGDSHRGAVATALVESLRQPSAADADLSVKATKGTEFPSSDAQWAKLFESA